MMTPQIYKEFRQLLVPFAAAIPLVVIPIAAGIQISPNDQRNSVAFDWGVWIPLVWIACALLGSASWGADVTHNRLHTLL